MNNFSTKIEMDKYLEEFIKTICWGSYKFVFKEALKSISYNHKDKFSFETIKFEECLKDTLSFIRSFSLDFQFIIYFKI
jgi:hypothetical protein